MESGKFAMPRSLFKALVWIILLAGLAFLSYAMLSGEKIEVVSKEIEINDADSPLSILTLGQVGSGQGGQWHFAPDLADAIVLLYFRPETGVVNLISLPRDLYGDLGGERIRINRVITNNKLPELLAALVEITGIETTKYVVFDLSLVKEVIDNLGGIEVNLPTSIYDPIGSFNLSAGDNHLNGEEAVWLIRNRYAPQGDFFREHNQHLVLEAIFTRFDQLNSLEKTSFLFRVLPRLSQSISNFSLGELIPSLSDTGGVSFNSIVLDFDTGLWQNSTITGTDGEEAYILIPKEGINQYAAVRLYIESRLR